jgi:O-methyltransferase
MLGNIGANQIKKQFFHFEGKYGLWSSMLKRIYRNVTPSIFRTYLFRIRVNLAKFILPPIVITYEADGFRTTNFLGFRTEDRFNLAYSTAIESLPLNDPFLGKVSIEWRAHICTWAANQAIKLEGDFVECGVWHGVLSKTICEYLDEQDLSKVNFYLVDTFGSMPGSHPDVNYQSNIYEEVKSRFSMYPTVQLIRGVVPECLTQITSTKIAYLAIDMNSSEAELRTLEYFYSKVVSGGIIYFDDYGWGYPELRTVVDNFFSDKPERLLHFPSGNSIVVKL